MLPHQNIQEASMKKAIFARKPADLSEVTQPFFQHSTPETYIVTETIAMTEAEYDEFGRTLLHDRNFFEGKGGTNKQGEILCLKITAPNRRALLINPEGCTYARYVAFEE